MKRGSGGKGATWAQEGTEMCAVTVGLAATLLDTGVGDGERWSLVVGQ